MDRATVLEPLMFHTLALIFFPKNPFAHVNSIMVRVFVQYVSVYFFYFAIVLLLLLFSLSDCGNCGNRL